VAQPEPELTPEKKAKQKRSLSNVTVGPAMCRSMVDIQSATAEIWREKKKKIEETTGQKYNSCPIP